MNKARVAFGLVALAALVAVLLFGSGGDSADRPARRSAGAGDAADAPPPVLTGRETSAPRPPSSSPVAPKAGEEAIRRLPIVARAIATDALPGMKVDFALMTPRVGVVARARGGLGTEVAFPPQPMGEYEIHAVAGHRRGQAAVEGAGPTLVHLQLERRVTGHVFGSPGRPLPGAWILPFVSRYGPVEWGAPDLDAEGLPGAAIARTDEEGAFEGVVPATVPTVLVYAPRFGGRLVWLGDGSDPTYVEVIFHERDFTLRRFHVVDETGNQVRPTVSWEEPPEGSVPPWAPGARFEVAWPREARDVGLLIEAPGFASTIVRDPPTGGEEQVVLKEVPTLGLTVRDTAGQRVPHALVIALRRQGRGAGVTAEVWTDARGEAIVPMEPPPERIHVMAEGLRPALLSADQLPPSGEIVLAEDDPVLLVLPEALAHVGSFDVTLEDESGRRIGKWQYTLTGRETTLAGLPVGPKTGRLGFYGRAPEQKVRFDDERRIEIGMPEDFPGFADVNVILEGGGDTDGVRVDAMIDGRSAHWSVVDGARATLRLQRDRAYDVALPHHRSVASLPIDVPAGQGQVEVRWPLPPTVRFVRWRVRVVDEVTGRPIGRSRITVGGRARGIQGGAGEVLLLAAADLSALVEARGYEPQALGPMGDAALLEHREVRLRRLGLLELTWDPTLAPRLELSRLRSSDDLDRLRREGVTSVTVRGGRHEIQLAAGERVVLWAKAGDLLAGPRTLGAGPAHLALSSPAEIRVVDVPEDTDVGPVAIWIEAASHGVGYAHRGRWRPSPYPVPELLAVRTPFDGESRTYALTGLPGGSWRLRIRQGETEIVDRVVTLEPGAVTEVAWPR